MPTLTELQEQRGRLVTQAREALDEIKSNTDEARAAELEARHDNIMGEFDRLDATISREQRQAEVEARLHEAAEAEKRTKKRPTGEDVGEVRGADEGVKTEYREVFYRYLSTGASLDELSAEERAVLKAGVAATGEKRAQTTGGGGGTAGGYTVPVELEGLGSDVRRGHLHGYLDRWW
jgi:HK97 family phage major capsid protein